MGLKARASLAVVMIGVAALVYHSLAKPQPPNLKSGNAMRTAAWVEKNLPAWRALKYVELSDSAGIRASARSVITHSQLLTQLSQEQRGQLEDTLATLFHALAAADPQEYVQRIQPLRKMRESVVEDPAIITYYKEMTGRPLPSDLLPMQALQLFRKNAAETVGRIVGVSLADPQGVAFSFSVRDARKWTDLPGREDVSSMWANTGSTGFVTITAPLQDLKQEVARVGKVRVLYVYCFVRTNSDRYFMVYPFMFWNPDAHCWRLIDMGVALTTERFTFWPL